MLVPILHRVIIKLEEKESKTESGIIIPEDILKKERKATEIGTVVAIGSTCFKAFGEELSTLKIGDKVIIAKYSGKEVRDLDDTEYVIVNDEDIICKLGV